MPDVQQVALPAFPSRFPYRFRSDVRWQNRLAFHQRLQAQHRQEIGSRGEILTFQQRLRHRVPSACDGSNLPPRTEKTPQLRPSSRADKLMLRFLDEQACSILNLLHCLRGRCSRPWKLECRTSTIDGICIVSGDSLASNKPTMDAP